MKITNPQELCKFLQLSAEQIQALNIDYKQPFKFRVPLHFAQQMAKKNIKDPLLLQVLPVIKESTLAVNFSHNPVADIESVTSLGLLQKYKNRVLLMLSPSCDINCRYCFRRHFPYKEHVNQRNWEKALEKIEQNISINEVILSGGDPMSLNEDKMVNICQRIEKIKSIQILRIHTRTPIVSPENACQRSFIKFCKQTNLNIILVTHCNHPNELSKDTQKVLQKYRQASITLLNQAVLLKDINDNAETLIKLSHKLLNQGVLPYYLHQLDKVSGAQHFEVPIKDASMILENLRQQLPGYLVPRWVQEVPQAEYKIPLNG